MKYTLVAFLAILAGIAGTLIVQKFFRDRSRRDVERALKGAGPDTD